MSYCCRNHYLDSLRAIPALVDILNKSSSDHGMNTLRLTMWSTNIDYNSDASYCELLSQGNPIQLSDFSGKGLCTQTRKRNTHLQHSPGHRRCPNSPWSSIKFAGSNLPRFYFYAALGGGEDYELMIREGQHMTDSHIDRTVFVAKLTQRMG